MEQGILIEQQRKPLFTCYQRAGASVGVGFVACKGVCGVCVGPRRSPEIGWSNQPRVLQKNTHAEHAHYRINNLVLHSDSRADCQMEHFHIFHAVMGLLV